MHQAGFGHGAVVSHGQKGFQYAVEAQTISVGSEDRLRKHKAFRLFRVQGDKPS
jgi:hypothetical protein